MSFILAFSILFFINVSNAQISNGLTSEITNAPGLSSSKNYVKNPDCAKNTLGIFASGGSLTKSTTTPLNEDTGSECAIDASSSGQTYTWFLNTLGQGMKGQNCEARFIFEGDASLYKAYIKFSTDKVTTDLQLTNESASKTVSINFPCGDLSAENTLVIESTSASAAAISVAKVYAGLATNLSNVAQASFVGGVIYPAQTNCSWTSSAVIGDVTDADCTTRTLSGSAAAPSSTWPGLSFSNLAPGEYIVYATGVGSTASAVSCNYGISDGTTTTSIMSANWGTGTPNYFPVSMVGRFTYTVAQSSVNFRIKFGNPQASSNCILTNSSTTDNTQTEIKVYRIPSSSELALKSQDSPWYVDATMDGANISIGVTAVTSYTEITDANLTLKPQSGSQPVGVMCSSTNAATTPSSSNTTCAAGNESVGINFAIPKPGTYEVCIQSTHYLDVDSGDRLSTTFQLIETPTNAQTLTLEGGTKINSFSQPSGGTNLTSLPFTNCSFFKWDSSGIKGVRLMYEQAIVNTPNNSLLLADADSNQGQRNLRWTVKPVTQQIPAPLLVGSVTSNSTGLERIERVSFGTTSSTACTASPCAYISQSGNWISSVTRGGTGSYTVNFNTGIWAAAPTCTCNSRDSGGGFLENCSIDIPSTSSVVLSTTDLATPTSRDGFVQIICMGSR